MNKLTTSKHTREKLILDWMPLQAVIVFISIGTPYLFKDKLDVFMWPKLIIFVTIVLAQLMMPILLKILPPKWNPYHETMEYKVHKATKAKNWLYISATLLIEIIISFIVLKIITWSGGNIEAVWWHKLLFILLSMGLKFSSKSSIHWWLKKVRDEYKTIEMKLEYSNDEIKKLKMENDRLKIKYENTDLRTNRYRKY